MEFSKLFFHLHRHNKTLLETFEKRTISFLLSISVFQILCSVGSCLIIFVSSLGVNTIVEIKLTWL